MNAPIKIKEPGSPGRVYTFNFTFGGLAALATAVTLSLSLFFVLGVLVGRGHRPEAAIPPIERIMPTEAPAKPAAEILKAEELTYSQHLGQKGPEATPARPIDKVERKAPEKHKTEDKPKAEDKAAHAKPEAKADAKAKAEQKPAPPPPAPTAKPIPAASVAVAKAPPAAAPKAEDEDTRRYDYIYQAASFPTQDEARAFLKRVKGLGLKADIESGTAGGRAWYRVVVFFQGMPSETRGLKEKLGTVGVPKPLMRSKTPA